MAAKGLRFNMSIKLLDSTPESLTLHYMIKHGMQLREARYATKRSTLYSKERHAMRQRKARYATKEGTVKVHTLLGFGGLLTGFMIKAAPPSFAF